VFAQACILNQTDKAMHITADAAKTAADAATNAINTNIAAERARLFVFGMRINRANEKDPNSTISFQIVNLGRTSAIITWVSEECTTVETPSNYKTPTYDKQHLHPASSVLVGGTALSISGSECVFDNPLTDNDFVALSEKKKVILFKGFVGFQDVFGEKFTQRFGYYSYGEKGDAFFSLVGADAYNAEIKGWGEAE
jgi:hypothetical protein